MTVALWTNMAQRRKIDVAMTICHLSQICLTVSLLAIWSSATTVASERLGGSHDSESVFDRVHRIYESTLDIPEVPRLEARLGISGERIDVGDVTLYVEKEGSGPGPPIILLNGGPGLGHHYFHPHMSAASNFAEIIYYDPRGVGKSDYKRPPHGYSSVDAAADLESLRIALEIDRWVLHAFSYGGVTAMQYAIRYPESTAGVVFVGALPPMGLDLGLGQRDRDYMSESEVARVADLFKQLSDSDASPSEPANRSARRASVFFNALMNGDWKRRWLHHPGKERLAQLVRYELVHDDTFYEDLMREFTALDFRGVFNSCPIPMLIVEGEFDLSYGSHKLDLFADQLPQADVLEVANAGHSVFIDQPTKYFDILRRFMAQEFEVDTKQLELWKSRTKFFNVE